MKRFCFLCSILLLLLSSQKEALSRQSILPAEVDTALPKRKPDSLRPAIFDLLSITGISSNGQNLISWKTDSRSQFTDFALERSTDEKSFTSIGHIGLAGNGKTNSFSYADNDPVAGRNFYRLKMTDSSGSTTYSAIISVLFAPVSGLQIHFDSQSATLGLAGMEKGSEYQLKVYNCNGQPMLQKTITTATASFSISQLPHGLYVVYVSDGGITSVNRKIIW